MPEGDTIFRTARTLHRALAGQIVTGFESVLPKLDRVAVDSGVTGRSVEKVEANGKWIVMYFSGDLILLTHMLMSGSWHIYRPGEKWHRWAGDMRLAVHTEKIEAVGFNVPIAEFHTPDTLRRRRVFNQIGPSVLAAEFDSGEALRRLGSRPELSVGEALLSQALLAGIGNVFKSEICFACGVNPFRIVGSLSISELSGLVATARKFLLANVTENSGDQIVTYTGLRRTTGRIASEENLWVYGRRGKPCRKCGMTIASRKQGDDARSTFWCERCQPLAQPAARHAS
ncbi:MAG TPA: DNA-formamidopyrimidine glycosylase family protein [Candidatus Saccharimonadales bacterium]|nr:DNA-formamidopyrimidine glycosylase family protein [Candidatus Saccharimonadales bacterium]